MQEPPRSYWSSSSHVYSMDGPDIWDESSGVLELILGVKKNRTTLQRGQDRSSNSLRVVQRTRTTGCIIVRHENTRATLVRGLTSACKVAQHSYCLSCNYFSSRQSLKISEQHGFFPDRDATILSHLDRTISGTTATTSRTTGKISSRKPL